MDFQQAERKFKELKASYEAGDLSEAEFKTQLEELMVQDEAGTWWMIGFETEMWYRHDGTEWVLADPPGSVSQKPLTPIEAEEEIVREKAEREDGEKAATDIVEPETVEGAHKVPSYPRPAAQHDTGIEPSKSKSRNWMVYAVIGFVGIALCCVSGIWMYNRLINQPAATVAPAPEEPAEEEPEATEAPAPEEPAEEEPEATEAPASEEPARELGVGSTMIAEKDGMVMVYVPAGEFQMGSDANDALAECQKYRSDCKRDWFTDEEPAHSIYLDDYWIDQTEVTNAMYSQCVEEGKCDPPSSTKSYTRDIYYGDSKYNDYPVIYVSWNNAKTYCEWAGRRLPSEAEWEKAAGWDEDSQSQRVYPWGNAFDSKVNFCDTNCSFEWKNPEFDDGYADTAPVGTYPKGASFYGALDLAGNVWEWVADWYDVYPGGDEGASDNYGQTYRVLRGGSWNDNNYYVRAANRNWNYPADSSNDLGFRCSRSSP
jgi:formylglycine-generating enzyme required for sulfatase activity